ncbi:MAG: putative MFS-type transporter YhjX [Syntrophorhabdus sp. PtaB.Bin047]|nr:MAG: putative MFS-type transporter YhjX [Syntrophorhabdus sp. PtaB.Bin047]
MAPAVSSSRRLPFFYGHLLVIAGYIIMLVMYGTLYSFGVFLKPLLAEPGWTRTSLLGAYSLCFFLSGALAAPAGWLTDRVGPAPVICASGIFLGVGYLLLSHASSVAAFFLWLGLIVGAGMSGGIAPVLSTVTRWYRARRGLMTGLVVAGVGSGTFVMPSVSSVLIAAFGWRVSFLLFGIVTGGAVAGLGLLFRREPRDMGLLPYGSQPGGANPNHNGPARGLSLPEAFRTVEFWILIGLYASAGFFIQIALVNTTIYAVELGAPQFRAAALLSVTGLGSIAGRLLGGFASDRLGTRPVLVVATLMMAAQFGLLLVSRGLPALFLFAGLFGITYGEILCAMPLLPAELFGLRRHGALLGVITFASTLGGGTGPLAAGFLFELFRNYNVVWSVCAAASLMAFILSLSTGKGRRRDTRIVRQRGH